MDATLTVTSRANLFSGNIEAGHRCHGGGHGSKDDCFENLLDGIDFGDFGCDDGNFVENDGCDKWGRIELGFICNAGTPANADRCLSGICEQLVTLFSVIIQYR